MKNLIFIFIICFSWSYNCPEDEAGDVSAIRTSFMDGNRVLLMFENTTQLSDWEAGGLDYVSIWPNDGTGTRMVDGIGLLVGAKTYIVNDLNPLTIDTEIVDDPAQINYNIDHEYIFFKQIIEKKWITILQIH